MYDLYSKEMYLSINPCSTPRTIYVFTITAIEHLNHSNSLNINLCLLYIFK